MSDQSRELSTGTRVSWNTPQGETTGHIVESDKTGARAGHTADALTPIDEDE